MSTCGELSHHARWSEVKWPTVLARHQTKEEGFILVHSVKGLSLSLRRQSRAVPWYWEHEMEHLAWQLFQE